MESLAENLNQAENLRITAIKIADKLKSIKTKMFIMFIVELKVACKVVATRIEFITI